MIKFKTNQEKKEYPLVKERLRIIAEDMAMFCNDNGYEFLITDVLSEESEDNKLKRVSKSHREGRAIDIRVHSWPLDFRKKFEQYFEDKYIDWAALSSNTLKPNLIVIHNNSNGIHCHVQTKPHEE